MNVTFNFSGAMRLDDIDSKFKPLPNLVITMRCFITRYPNYRQVFKVDGMIGLAPVVKEMSDYSFISQIVK